MATIADIINLKNHWKSDPIFDMWNVEGFEEHEQELRKYQQKWENMWREGRIQELESEGLKMGISENLDLVFYIKMLERRIEALEEKVDT